MMKQYGYREGFEKLAGILRGEAGRQTGQNELARATA
jgi:hypothetical protein